MQDIVGLPLNMFGLFFNDVIFAFVDTVYQ